jgi:hypothetical protein
MASLQAKLHIPNGYILPHSDAYHHVVNDNIETSYPELRFWAEDSAEWSLEGDSVCEYTPEQWRLLLAAPSVMEFGDVYGSHVDNGIVRIKHENGRLEFVVDGARGGKMRWSLPIDLCREAIEHVATRIEIHLAVQATEPADE